MSSSACPRQAARDDASAADQSERPQRLASCADELTRVAVQHRQVGPTADLEYRLGRPTGVGAIAEPNDDRARQVDDVRVAA
jgi:hypothetical protein